MPLHWMDGFHFSVKYVTLLILEKINFISEKDKKLHQV